MIIIDYHNICPHLNLQLAYNIIFVVVYGHFRARNTKMGHLDDEWKRMSGQRRLHYRAAGFPDGEFCVYGTVILTSDSSSHIWYPSVRL